MKRTSSPTPMDYTAEDSLKYLAMANPLGVVQGLLLENFADKNDTFTNVAAAQAYALVRRARKMINAEAVHHKAHHDTRYSNSVDAATHDVQWVRGCATPLRGVNHPATGTQINPYFHNARN